MVQVVSKYGEIMTEASESCSVCYLWSCSVLRLGVGGRPRTSVLHQSLIHV